MPGEFGSELAPNRAELAPTRAELAPTRAVLDPTSPVVAPARAVLAPTRAVPAPTWAVLAPTRAVLAPTRAMLASTWAVLAPRWAELAPNRAAFDPRPGRARPDSALLCLTRAELGAVFSRLSVSLERPDELTPGDDVTACGLHQLVASDAHRQAELDVEREHLEVIVVHAMPRRGRCGRVADLELAVLSFARPEEGVGGSRSCSRPAAHRRASGRTARAAARPDLRTRRRGTSPARARSRCRAPAAFRPRRFSWTAGARHPARRPGSTPRASR